MTKQAERLKRDIIESARDKGIDPYKTPFSPKDLGLRSDKYGSFSDYCDDTESAKWAPDAILNVVETDSGGRPKTYTLKI